MAAGASRKTHWQLLILLIVTLLLSGGVTAAWRAIDKAIASDADFSTDEVPTTVSRLAPLVVSNVSVEIGDMVFLNNVRLDVGPKPNLFVVTGSNGLRMLVTLETNDRPSAPLPKSVDVKGIIRRLPAPRILRKEWTLSTDQIDHFGRQGVYIAAESITGQ